MCINLSNSNLFAINVENGFLNTTSTFLACEIGMFPFLFLGIPVGENHMHNDTWTCLWVVRQLFWMQSLTIFLFTFFIFSKLLEMSWTKFLRFIGPLRGVMVMVRGRYVGLVGIRCLCLRRIGVWGLRVLRSLILLWSVTGVRGF